jgi:hypothetical protein
LTLDPPFYLDLNRSQWVFEALFPLRNRFVSHQSPVCCLRDQPVGSALDRVLLLMYLLVKGDMTSSIRYVSIDYFSR